MKDKKIIEKIIIKLEELYGLWSSLDYETLEIIENDMDIDITNIDENIITLTESLDRILNE